MSVKRPYLIQKGVICKYDADLKLSAAVRMQYMGSAEYEFGALPKSLREVEKGIKNYKLSRLEGVNENQDLFLLSNLSDEDLEKYKNYLINLKKNKIILKEHIGFCDSRFKANDDFWWDINNHLFFSYDEKFMKIVKRNVESSLLVMNMES